MPNRLDLLNFLIKRKGYKSFLLIGDAAENQFWNVSCSDKLAVNPTGAADYKTTSDKYFAASRRLFDLILIDGDRRCEHVSRDVLNALDHLNPGGAVVVHDTLPINMEQTRQLVKGQGEYLGDGWRVIATLARHPRLDIAVGAFDYGCAVIIPRPNAAPQEAIPARLPGIRSWTWEQFQKIPLFKVLQWPELCQWIN